MDFTISDFGVGFDIRATNLRADAFLERLKVKQILLYDMELLDDLKKQIQSSGFSYEIVPASGGINSWLGG